MDAAVVSKEYNGIRRRARELLWAEMKKQRSEEHSGYDK